MASCKKRNKNNSKHVLYSENTKLELWAYECHCSGLSLENTWFLSLVENWM